MELEAKNLKVDNKFTQVDDAMQIVKQTEHDLRKQLLAYHRENESALQDQAKNLKSLVEQRTSPIDEKLLILMNSIDDLEKDMEDLLEEKEKREA